MIRDPMDAMLDADLATDPPGERRAALALHASGALDRAWVLARLGPAQRERLLELLAELDGLGATFDTADLEAMFATAGSADQGPGQIKDSLAQSAGSAGSAQWASWLPNEPAWVSAALGGTSTAFAPAAQAALRDAAMRRRANGVEQPRRAAPAATLRRTSWLDGVRRWLP